jgi:hypothetical protein
MDRKFISERDTSVADEEDADDGELEGDEQPESQSRESSMANDSAPRCPSCTGPTVSYGACYKCLNCGETVG